MLSLSFALWHSGWQLYWHVSVNCHQCPKSIAGLPISHELPAALWLVSPGFSAIFMPLLWEHAACPLEFICVKSHLPSGFVGLRWGRAQVGRAQHRQWAPPYVRGSLARQDWLVRVTFRLRKCGKHGSVQPQRRQRASGRADACARALLHQASYCGDGHAQRRSHVRTASPWIRSRRNHCKFPIGKRTIRSRAH